MSKINIDKSYNICCNVLRMNNLADVVKSNRRSRGWTQEQLARNLGVTLHTVQRWESGRTQPSPLAMEKLRALFNDSYNPNQLRLV